MEKSQEHIRYLWNQFIEDKSTTAEVNELIAYIKNNADDTYSKEFLATQMAKYQSSEGGDEEFWSESLDRILQFQKSAIPAAGLPVATDHRVHFLKRVWFRYAAAILIVFASVAYLWTTHKKAEQTLAKRNKQLPADIAPGGNRAVLTLADGTQISLDNAANGSLAQQGTVQVMKLDNGQVAYKMKGSGEREVMMNTMSTPKGGQYQLILPDGSKVWLNAASSITFPAAFVGEQRNVRISGEVYFEVAQNGQKPFIVDINGRSTVQVLGTSFNINSYENERNITTTLVNGSVKINQRLLLKPGQQAVQFLNPTAGTLSSDRKPKTAGIDSSADITVTAANIDQTLAWKNGWFDFNEANLYEVMRQLERWYEIEVRYEGRIPEVTFQGKMDKNVTLSGMLNIFSSLNFKIKIRLEGRTLIVSGT